MKHKSLGHILAALCAVVLGTLPPAAPLAAHPAPQRTEAFTPAACMFDLPASAVEGQDIECGFVTVPQQHADPDGPTIRLPVAIIKSHDPNPAPDPLFMAQGGPGGSAIDTFAEPLLGDSPLRANRDIVLFDQRGTIDASPSLACPEEFDLLISTIERKLDDAESDRLQLEASGACHDRLVGAGVDLAAFNSLENAADVEALRLALGYEQINLYGVSYGTLLALHVMREHPTGLRSVILDSVVPPQTNFLIEATRSENRAFSELFQACAGEPDCNAAYPNLEQVFFDLVVQLDQQPARVPLTDPETNKIYNAVFDGEGMIAALFQMLYATQLIPALPKMIYDVRDGDYRFLSRIYALLLFDRTVSTGMYYSVICAEDADFRPQDVPIEGVRPRLAKDARHDADTLIVTCRRWSVPDLGPAVDAPVVSDIPTLVFSGRFDPITPPAFGAEVAQTLNHSYAFTFPNTGHGALLDGGCPAQIGLSFLEAPDRPPESGCFQQQGAPVFITPTTVLMTPSIERMLATLNGDNLTLLLIYALGVAVLLSCIIVWPLAWLVRLLRRQPGERRAAALLARGLALLVGLLALGFAVGLLVVLLLAENNDNIALFFGLPTRAAPLFALPPLVVLLTAGIVGCTLLAWRKRFWSLLARVYYTLLALAAITVTGVLISWGLPLALLGM